MTTPEDWAEFTPADAVLESHDRWPTFDLDYAVEADDGGREQCTIFPREASEEDILTTWIAADEEDFLPLSDVL